MLKFNFSAMFISFICFPSMNVSAQSPSIEVSAIQSSWRRCLRRGCDSKTERFAR